MRYFFFLVVNHGRNPGNLLLVSKVIVCYWGHSVGALSVCIVCNMIVSLSMRTAMSRTPQQDFALFSALLLVCLRPFPTELSH